MGDLRKLRQILEREGVKGFVTFRVNAGVGLLRGGGSEWES